MSASVYQITSPWDENAVTWNKATSTANWKQKAGDYNPQPLGTHSFNPSQTLMKWHDIDITSAVRTFVKDPSKNYGIIIVLISKAEAVFHSSENSNSELRPKLTVDYEPVTSISEPVSLLNNNMAVQKVANGFNVSLKDYKNSSIDLYEVNGMKVKTIIPSKDKLFISSQGLPKGIYFLRVKNRLTGAVGSLKISH